MMKSHLLRLFAIAFLLVLLIPNDSKSAQERRTALVIGNGAYKSSPLGNPVNDANDMAAALKELGFSVRLKINANQRSMERSIREFGKDLRSGSIGLFYFAGHGLQVHGRNYLVPIGADPPVSGSVAADGTGRNGLYSSKLLKYMMESGLSYSESF